MGEGKSITEFERTRMKIVSGGQTGVDRAALDVAMEIGLETGGWCPSGRRAEDGPIRVRYPLDETPSSSFSQRTEWNVRDSDGTLILHRGTISGGTRLTAELARRYERPLLMLDLSKSADLEEVRCWLITHRIQALNVAGPRESGEPGIWVETRSFLTKLLSLSVSRS